MCLTCAEWITLGYYIIHIALTAVIFGVGTLYIRSKDRSDKERRVEEDRRDHKRREWRQFTERVNSEYSELRSSWTLKNILKIEKTFIDLPVHSKVTGLDVLRYWLADDRDLNVSSESPQLRALREDLHKIFLQLNFCSSLIHLGEVPKNIKEELRYVVEELGNVAKPFLTGEKLSVALTCLRHFGRGIRDEEISGRVGDRKLEEFVPYVNSLRLDYVENDRSSQVNEASSRGTSTEQPRMNHHRKLWFNVSMRNIKHPFLQDLHRWLEKEGDKTIFVKMCKERLPESPLILTDHIGDGDCDKVVLAKVLHEVRYYLHHLQSNPQLTNINGRNVSHMKILDQFYEEIVKPPRYSLVIEKLIKRSRDDLEQYLRNPPKHLRNSKTYDKFYDDFSDVWSHVKELFTVEAQERREKELKHEV